MIEIIYWTYWCILYKNKNHCQVDIVILILEYISIIILNDKPAHGLNEKFNQLRSILVKIKQ